MFDATPHWLIAMNLWTAVLLAVAVVADRLLARRVRASWRVALYCTIAVRLMLPADWHSPLGALGNSAAEPAAIAVAQQVDVDALLVSDAARGVEDRVVAAAPVTPSPSRVGEGLFVVWCAGAALLLGLFAARRRALAVAVGRSIEARSSVRARAGGASVVEHAELGPLTFGAWRPRIVLPRGLVDVLSADELGHVLDHECAHVQRHDGLLVAVLGLGCAVLWPVLPLWIAAARVRALIERAADERALLGASAAERVAFGRTLLRLAGVPGVPASALALGGYRDLRGRIAAVRGGAPLPVAVQVATLGAAVALPIACAGHAEAPNEPRCAELKASAAAAHDRFERGTAEQAAVALKAYDSFASECTEVADRGDVLYYRAELQWSLAHAMHKNGGDTREAFALAHRGFLDALAAGTEQFEVDAATAQMHSKRAELGITDVPPASEPLPDPDVVHVDRGPSIHDIPATDYDAAELQLLASYDVFEAHVDDPTNPDLHKVLHSRATLAMKHHRFTDARPPLQRLLDAPGDDTLHVNAAEMLVDLHTIAWTDPRAPAERRGAAGAELLVLCDRLPTLALWQHASAERLRRAVPTLRAGVTASSN